MRIGSWNMGVPDRDSNMGSHQVATAQWMADNMSLLNRLDLDLLAFQEVSKYWAEQAQMQLQRRAGSVSWTLQHDDKKAILMKDTAVYGRASVGLGLVRLGGVSASAPPRGIGCCGWVGICLATICLTMAWEGGVVWMGEWVIG